MHVQSVVRVASGEPAWGETAASQARGGGRRVFTVMTDTAAWNGHPALSMMTPAFND